MCGLRSQDFVNACERSRHWSPLPLQQFREVDSVDSVDSVDRSDRSDRNVAQSWAFGKSLQCASAKRAVGWPWMAHAKTIAMVFERDDRKSRKRI